jgi:hypothetical protein
VGLAPEALANKRCHIQAKTDEEEEEEEEEYRVIHFTHAFKSHF